MTSQSHQGLRDFRGGIEIAEVKGQRLMGKPLTCRGAELIRVDVYMGGHISGKKDDLPMCGLL